MNSRDDYGAINVISDEEREILGIGGSKKPEEEEEKLFETIGKAADKIGETKVGKKIGTIITVIMLAILSGGANMSIIHDYLNGDEEIGPIGGCLQMDATNYNPQATFDDGTCNFLLIIYGCTNSESPNYNPNATHDDGRCVVINENPGENETVHNETIYGCIDVDAVNFDDKATDDDGSCEYDEQEYVCNLTKAEFYPAYYDNNTGNYSDFYIDSEPLGIHILTDVDVNDACEASILVYIDAVTYVNETEEWLIYYKDIYFDVWNAEWDNHWINMSMAELNNTYGMYDVYVSLLADLDDDGEYEYYDYLWIENIEVKEEEV